MKILTIIFATVVVSLNMSCTTNPKNEDALEIRYKHLEESFNLFTKEIIKLLKEHGEIENARMKNLEDRIRLLQQDMLRVQRDLSKIQDAGKTTTNPEIQNLAVQTTKILTRLKGDPLYDDQKAFEDLKSLGVGVIPIVVSELKKYAVQIDEFVGKMEKLLARFAPANLSTHLAPLLKEKSVRVSAVTVIRHAKDKGLSDILVPLISDVDDEFKSQLVVALIECKNKAGIIVGLELLASQDDNVRFLTFTTLKSVAVSDFGYKPFDKPDTKENVKAIEDFKSWYNTNKENIWKQ